MKKPVIASLDIKEHQELITHVEQNLLNSTDKEVIVEELNFYNDLVEKLIGFKADNIKKLLQIH